jgi:hypothetical protein
MTYEEMERLPVTDLAKVLAEIRMDKRFREYQHRCDEKWRAYKRRYVRDRREKVKNRE